MCAFLQLTTTIREEPSSVLSCEGDDISTVPDMASAEGEECRRGVAAGRAQKDGRGLFLVGAGPALCHRRALAMAMDRHQHTRRDEASRTTPSQARLDAQPYTSDPRLSLFTITLLISTTGCRSSVSCVHSLEIQHASRSSGKTFLGSP
jgi:hypothetical protein